MISLQEFFNRPEHAQAKGIVQKNNIIKRNIIAHMAIAGDPTLAHLAKKLRACRTCLDMGEVQYLQTC